MADKRIPDAWIGGRVVALVVTPWGMTDARWGTPSSRSLTAWQEVGLLEDVNELGILATFDDEDEPPTSTFYPWGAVLSLRPA